MPTPYDVITDRIVKQLEQGVIPWRQPWQTLPPVSLNTLRAYRGVNVFLLASQGYGSPYWLTFNQVKKLGGHVRKGEHGTPVTFWKIGDEHVAVNPDTKEERKTRSILLRYYTVFNLEQTENIANVLGLSSVERVPKLEECERIVSQMPNRPGFEQSHKAWYNSGKDVVGMPSKTAFCDTESYYSTMFHELVHSTGHPHRLDRFAANDTDHRFGSESYSKEELVAELGAAMLCGVTGIAPATIDRSAAYLKSWIDVLKGDSRLVVSAASLAQKAADFITGNVDADVERDIPEAN